MGSVQRPPEGLRCWVYCSKNLLQLYYCFPIHQLLCVCQGLRGDSLTATEFLFCAARGEGSEWLLAAPGSKPSCMSQCFAFATHVLLHHYPSTAGIYLKMQTNRFPFPIFSFVVFRREPVLGDAASDRLLTCGDWWWNHFLSPARVVFHFGAEAQLFPTSRCQPCRSQLCPGDGGFSPAPLASLELVESPKGGDPVAPSRSRGTSKSNHRLFFNPSASFRSSNLEPVVTSSPVLIFSTDFGWVCL